MNDDIIKKTSFSLPSMSGILPPSDPLQPASSETATPFPLPPSPPNQPADIAKAYFMPLPPPIEDEPSPITETTISVPLPQLSHTVRKKRRASSNRHRFFTLIILIALLVLGVGIGSYAYIVFIVPRNTSFSTHSKSQAQTAHIPASSGNQNRPANAPLNTESKTFHIGDHPSLRVKAHSSNINIHAGDAQTVIVAAKQQGNHSLVDENDPNIQYTQTQDAQGHDQIGITTRPGDKNIDYDLTVPATTQVQIETDAGSISVDGIGGITIDTNSGSLDIANVQGSVNVYTESGDITARTITGPTTLEAVNGSIRATAINGTVKAITQNGDVVVRQTNLQGASALETNNGSVSFDGSLDPQGSSKLKTNSGDVTLSIPASTAFQLTASTGSGSIHNEFGSTTVGNTPRTQITISIGNGSITINKAV